MAELHEVTNSLQIELDQLQKTKQALAESEGRLRATFEQAPVGIVHGDILGKIVWANSRVHELFGYEDGDPEFLKLTLWKCTHPDDMWTVTRYKDLLAGKIEDYTVEKRYLRTDGQVWWASVSCSAVLGDEGTPKYCVVIVEDITKRKQAEEVLKQSHEQLEAKVADRTAELEAANTALKVMLKHRAEEKKKLEEKVLANSRQIVEPFLQRLLASGLTADQKSLAQAVHSGLAEITSSFAHELSSKMVGLTARELEVARLVRDGKSSSEIAQLLSVSENAVTFHRQNIRTKLGIKNRKVNLSSYLRHMIDH